MTSNTEANVTKTESVAVWTPELPTLLCTTGNIATGSSESGREKTMRTFHNYITKVTLLHLG